MPLTPTQRQALEDVERIETAIVATRRQLDLESDKAFAEGKTDLAFDLLDRRRRLLPELQRTQATKRKILRGASLGGGIAGLNDLAGRAHRVKRRLDSLSDALDAARRLVEIGRALSGIIPG